MIATQAEIKQAWIDYGGGRGLAKVMSAIAMAESNGDSEAINDNPATGDYSVGWWQINYYGRLRAARTRAYGSPQALQKDVAKQVKAAKAIAGPGGVGLSNWSTYRNGTYLQHMGKGAASTKDLPNQSNKDADERTTLGSRIIDSVVPGAKSVGDIADVVRFMYEEHGLIRIAEVILGFGALTLGAAALMIDAASKSPVGQAALAATGVGSAAATGGKIRNTVSKVADEPRSRHKAVKAAKVYRERKDAKNFERKYGMTEDQATKMTEDRKDFPKRAVIHDEPIYHKSGRGKQTEGARRRQTHAAQKKRAMSGEF